jgi:hypothetical protein
MNDHHVLARLAIILHVWWCALAVHVGLRRHQLPQLVEHLGRGHWRPPFRLNPSRLGRIVERSLHVGWYRPRCLVASLVLYRLLRAQGDRAALVLGLPSQPTEQHAHAWVEIDGVDVGPPPGRGDHRELARFGG